MKYLVAGETGKELANELSAILGWEILHVESRTFPDGETYLRFPKCPSEGDDILVIQSLHSPQEYNLFQLLNILTDLHSRGANVSALTPYFCYARADREVRPGDVISARTVLQLIESTGCKHLYVADIHNPEVLNFTSMGVSNILPAKSFAKHFNKSFEIDNTWMVVAPDVGAKDRASALAGELNLDLKCLNKKRDPLTGTVSVTLKEEITFTENVILVDDIMSSGGSVLKAAQVIRENGGEKIFLAISHLMKDENIAQLEKKINGKVFASISVPSKRSIVSIADDVMKYLK